MLNFANITGNPADDWVGQGIAESLTADLTRIKSVVGRARASRSSSCSAASASSDAASTIARRWSLAAGSARRSRSAARINGWAIAFASPRRASKSPPGRQIADRQGGRPHRGALRAAGPARVRAGRRVSKVNVAQQDLSAIADAGTQSLEAYQAFARGMMNLRLAETRFDGSRDRAARAGDRARSELRRGDGRARRRARAQRLVRVAAGLVRARAWRWSIARSRFGPDDAAAHVQRGDTLLVMGRADEAIAALQEGVRLQGDRARRRTAAWRAPTGSARAASTRRSASSSGRCSSIQTPATCTCSWPCCTRCAATTRRPRTSPRKRFGCRTRRCQARPA